MEEVSHVVVKECNPVITLLFLHLAIKAVIASDRTAYMPQEQRPPLSESYETDLAQEDTADSLSEPCVSACEAEGDKLSHLSVTNETTYACTYMQMFEIRNSLPHIGCV